MATKTLKIGALILTIFIASMAIMLSEQVKLSVSAYSTTFYIWEGKWIQSGTETSKILSTSRGVTTINQFSDETTVTMTRTASYSSSTLIDSYLFNGKVTDVESFPIDETHRVLNGIGKIYQYEFTGFYSGETQTVSTNTFSFDKKMKIEWKETPYFAKVTKLSNGKGKITLKYTVSSNDETYSIRMFDPTVLTYVSPTDANNSYISRNWTYINITSTENLNKSYITWGNSTGIVNVTMSNSSLTNWYINMSSLVDRVYNYTRWTQNSTGTWLANTTYRYVTVDTTLPSVITYVSPTINNNTFTPNNWYFVNITFTETNPDTCYMTENGVNMTMTRVLNNCYMNMTGKSEGNYNYNVTVNDSAGNVNRSVNRLLKIDYMPTYSLNQTNSTYVGKPVLHSLYWQDNINLSGYIFSFDNGTGSFTNNTWVAMTGIANWSNVTKSINLTANSTIRWMVYANDSANNLNTSAIFTYKSGTPDVNCSLGSGISKVIYSPSFNVNSLPNGTNIFSVNATGQSASNPLFTCYNNGTSEGIFIMAINGTFINKTDTCGTSSAFANAINLTVPYQNIGVSTVNGNSINIFCYRSFNSTTFTVGNFRYNISIN